MGLEPEWQPQAAEKYYQLDVQKAVHNLPFKFHNNLDYFEELNFEVVFLL
jgi:hypothetical protein